MLPALQDFNAPSQLPGVAFAPKRARHSVEVKCCARPSKLPSCTSMKLTIFPRRIARILTVAVLFLTFASFTAQIGHIAWDDEGILVILQPFDVGREESIPTWYSSVALLLCSILLAIIAATKKSHSERYTLHWGVLSAIFLLLSVDEVAILHESIGGEVGSSLAEFIGFTPRGFIFFVWVVPGTIFVLILLLAYLRFLLQLPKKTLLLFLIAGATFVAGALGVEMLESQQYFSLYESGVKERDAPVNFQVRYAVGKTIEEALEMTGVSVFIYALVSYISSYSAEVTVQTRNQEE